MATPIYLNHKSSALLKCLDCLTSAVSSDLPRIANRCAAEGLISTQELEEAHLQSKTGSVRANELLRRVIDRVSVTPRHYDVFLGILEESHMCATVVSEVKKCEEQQAAIAREQNQVSEDQERTLSKALRKKISQECVFYLVIVIVVSAIIAVCFDPDNYLLNNSEYYGSHLSSTAKVCVLFSVFLVALHCHSKSELLRFSSLVIYIIVIYFVYVMTCFIINHGIKYLLIEGLEKAMRNQRLVLQFSFYLLLSLCLCFFLFPTLAIFTAYCFV